MTGSGTILRGIAATVEQQPQAAAVVWKTELARSKTETLPSEVGSSTITYRQLWDTALDAATRLRDLLPKANEGGVHDHEAGTCRDDDGLDLPPRVGVMVNEGPGLPLIELAALIGGLAIVPLDPNDAPQRIAYVIQDASPSVIVTKDAHGTAVAKEALKLADEGGAKEIRESSAVVMEAGSLLRDSTLWSDMSSGSQARKDAAGGTHLMPSWDMPAAGAVSHIFFTSGSTGRPKGCISTHSNLAHYAAAKAKAHSISSSDIVFVASSHTFDPSLGDFVSAWCAGAAVALATRRATFSSLGACLSVSKATHVSATPSVFNTLPGSGWSHPAQLPDLRVVALGGEPMPKSIPQVWGSHVTLLNTYGVTECCVYQACSRILPGASPRTLGHALPGGTSLLLVAGEGDDPNVLVEDGSGEWGEIWIAGPQVGLGYLKRPEITRERYVKGPHGLGLCFRTGDIARAASTGWELVGRRDGQVKLNGQRVELGEIEEVILSTSRDSATLGCDLLQAVAVVLAKAKQTNGRAQQRSQLVAWCVPSCPEEYWLMPDEQNTEGDSSAPDQQDGRNSWAMPASANLGAIAVLETLLRRLVSSKLPNHMVPSRFIAVESLPTTPNGKVARSRLSVRPVPSFWQTHSCTGADEVQVLHEHQEDEDPEGGIKHQESETDVTCGWGPVVAKIWEEELGVPLMLSQHGSLPGGSAYTAANWDSLGGDSLGALRCCQRISARLRDERSRVAEAAKSTNHQDTGSVTAAGGEFGELLGPLAPAELLQRPVLALFCQHLSAELGPFPGEASPQDGESSQHQTSNQKHTSDSKTTDHIRCGTTPEQACKEEDPMVSLAYDAASAGCVSVLKALLRTPSRDPQAGVDPNGRRPPSTPSSGQAGRCSTLLHTAAAQGHHHREAAAGVVKLLIAAGASPSLPDQSGATPLHIAARKGPVDVVKDLLIAGASLAARDDSQQTLLHHAARADPPLAVWKVLIDCWQGDNKVTGSSGSGRQHKGSQKARSGGRKESPSMGLSIDVRDKWERTPLHWAVVNGHGKAVGVLLEAGANSKAVDSARETPLQIAERRAQCGAKDRGGARASVFGAIATQLGGSAKTVKGDKSQLFAGA